MWRHTTIYGCQRFAGGCVTDFIGDLDVGNTVRSADRNVKCPHAVTGDFTPDFIQPQPQRVSECPIVSGLASRVTIVRKEPRGIGVALLLPLFVSYHPCGQSLMYPHKRIYGFLIFRPAHTHGFAIGGNPARLIRLGVRPHLQGFACPQAGEGFKCHLPAKCFTTDVGEQNGRDLMQCFCVVWHELPTMAHRLGRAITRPAKIHRILQNQIGPHPPKQGIAQCVQIHIHRAVTRAAFDVFFPPSVVTVKERKGNLGYEIAIEELQQDNAVAAFTFHCPSLTLLPIMVGVAVLLVAPDDFSNRHLAFGPFHCRLAEAGPPPM